MAKNKNKAKPKAPRYNAEMAEETTTTKLLKNNTANERSNK